jgi:RNA polymerase I-specific transcription initiation factor RRN3
MLILQFVLFYTCALDSAFAERFVGRLLHQIRNSDRPAITRATCAAYLGSFLARAAFVDDSTL